MLEKMLTEVIAFLMSEQYEMTHSKNTRANSYYFNVEMQCYNDLEELYSELMYHLENNYTPLFKIDFEHNILECADKSLMFERYISLTCEHFGFRHIIEISLNYEKG